MQGSLKKLLSLNCILPFRKGWKFIFIYHDISGPSSKHFSPGYSTLPQNFKKQLDFLQKNFILVSLDELLEKEDLQNQNFASIVFDDGFASVEKVALPILQERSISFAVFVNQMAVELDRLWVSELILNDLGLLERLQKFYGINNTAGQFWINKLSSDKHFNNNIHAFISQERRKDAVYMDRESIIRLKKEGVTIGSHGCSHAVLSLCDKSFLDCEISENKKFLDNLLDQNTLHFAFPFGKREHYTSEVINCIRNVGHKYIYTSNPVGFKDPAELIPRIGITNESCNEITFYINRQFLKSINI